MRKVSESKGAFLVALLVTGALALGYAAATSAHDVPSDVVVHAYLKAEPGELRLLVRVPLEAMRDVVLPLRGPGYLDIGTADQALHDAATIWIANEVELYAGERRLTDYEIKAARVSLPSDRSFGSYDSALASLTGPPLPAATDLIWNQALLDVLLVYPVSNPGADFSIKPNFQRLGLRTTTAMLFISESGAERPYEFAGDPGLIRLDPRWHQAFFRFIALGFAHILDGTDHLLFILCLIIPVRRLRPLIVIITSFTLAHSITLLSSAFGFLPKVLWFQPLIEMLIAVSIVYMALENIIGGKLERRWMIAFGFGLVHGFGFAYALSETLQFAGSHLLMSLLAFNLGVEFGQLAVILLALPIISLFFHYVPSERFGVIVLSALLAHSGWHWMSERAAILVRYSFQWPAFDRSLLDLVTRWALLLLLIALVLWLLTRLSRRLTKSAGNVD